MPARKRRHDLTRAEAAEARADAQLEGLRDAAARAERLHDWLDASKPQMSLADLPVAEVASAKPRRRFWPFGPKEPTPAERFQAILAELKATAADGPSAAERAHKQAAAPSVPVHDRRRAAG